MVDAAQSSAVLSLDPKLKLMWARFVHYSYTMASTCTMCWTQQRIRRAGSDILPLSVIRISHVIFLWNFCVVYWCHNQNKAVKIKAPTLLVTSAFHICPYIFISSETNRPNKSPGNGWNWSRRPQSTWVKWNTDANGYPGGATFLLSYYTY